MLISAVSISVFGNNDSQIEKVIDSKSTEITSGVNEDLSEELGTCCTRFCYWVNGYQICSGYVCEVGCKSVVIK